ncbi:MAG: type II toxin-antitoxin system VapB family antitoxin [Rubrobacteraceae bacterium]
MRTTVTIPDEMLEDLMSLTEASTRTEAVNRAVAEWVRLRKIQEIRSLRGKLSFDRGIEEIRRADIEELNDLESFGAD